MLVSWLASIIACDIFLYFALFSFICFLNILIQFPKLYRRLINCQQLDVFRWQNFPIEEFLLICSFKIFTNVYANQVHLSQRWIGCSEPVEWTRRSPDFNSLDLFLWGYLRNKMYSSPINNLEELRISQKKLTFWPMFNKTFLLSIVCSMHCIFSLNTLYIIVIRHMYIRLPLLWKLQI